MSTFAASWLTQRRLLRTQNPHAGHDTTSSTRLNGLELQETIRSQGYCTPVILVTAYPNEQQRKRALDNGAVGFLSKPFDEGSLITCINKVINPALVRQNS
jgi:CheY-like chemotaxis protein